MAHKFEIIGQALVVTDTITTKVILDAPKGEVYYNAEELEASVNPKIRLYDISGTNIFGNVQYDYDLSFAIDSTNTPFTVATFKTFARTNLGFKSASFSETDPIFGASEASLFVSGDKAKLNNQSGTNTGDETTLSIQTKRPLKTIEGLSLEGSGNISLILNGSAIANSTNAGRLRYYTDASFSYIEVCMQSLSGTYEWFLISQQAII